MEKIKIIIVMVIASILLSALVGCGPPQVEKYEEIGPSETAFMIKLEGDTQKGQAKFMSEEFLEKNKVSTKRIKYTQRKRVTGRYPADYEWILNEKIIKVDRKPVTREWTGSTDTGTSEKNEGVRAESKESITFVAGMSAAAQIEESDAAKFLYFFNNEPLSTIMDSQIRPYVESRFIEECGKRTLDQIITEKDKIMTAIREDAKKHFKDKGITITVLGYKGDFGYPDENIQKAINEKFIANRDNEAQKKKNQTRIESAQAEAQAAKILQESAGGVAYQLRMKELQLREKELTIQSKAVEKWNGQLPQVSGNNSSIISLPLNTNK